MERQRERARASWKGAEKGAVAPAYQKLVAQGRTRFVGYEELAATSRVIGLLVDHERSTQFGPAREAELVLDRTPFYAETGGQVGDRGSFIRATGEQVADVQTAYPAVPGLTVHRIAPPCPIRVGDELRAEVAAPLRCSTMRNHTATHLLHAALRQVLGTHVKQAGSVVEPPPPALRFHSLCGHGSGRDRRSGAPGQRADPSQHRCRNQVLPLEQAVATGAMALFGEKYGDEVRVVTFPASARSCAAART